MACAIFLAFHTGHPAAGDLDPELAGGGSGSRSHHPGTSARHRWTCRARGRARRRRTPRPAVHPSPAIASSPSVPCTVAASSMDSTGCMIAHCTASSSLFDLRLVRGRVVVLGQRASTPVGDSSAWLVVMGQAKHWPPTFRCPEPCVCPPCGHFGEILPKILFGQAAGAGRPETREATPTRSRPYPRKCLSASNPSEPAAGVCRRPETRETTSTRNPSYPRNCLSVVTTADPQPSVPRSSPNALPPQPPAPQP